MEGGVKTRMDRFEEGLQVISALIRKDEPVSFAGRFYKLENAHLMPWPERPTRLLVGGSGRKRTLPLAARYADLWNCHPDSPEEFTALNSRLDELMQAEGREPAEIERSAMIPILMYRSQQDLDRYIRACRQVPIFSTVDDKQAIEMTKSMKGIIGSPQQVMDQMQAFAEAGLDEFVIQWFIPHDLEGVELLASELLPNFERQAGVKHGG